MSKRNSWVPQKPKSAKRCKDCRGTGKKTYWDYHNGYPTQVHKECNRCGGKGYV